MPNLSVYSATKSGLVHWADGLRNELRKYGVKVIDFDPGDFPSETNMLAYQSVHTADMKKELSGQELDFYGEFLDNTVGHIDKNFAVKPPRKISDSRIYRTFNHALLSPNPKEFYCSANWGFHITFKVLEMLPKSLRQKVLEKLVQTPMWK